MAKGKLLREKRAAEQRKDWREVATLCNALGGELQAEGDLQGALEHHRQEQLACTQLQDTLGIGVAHRRIGEVLCELGNTEEALVHQQQHLNLAKEAGSLLEQQRAYATIGRTLLDRAIQQTTADDVSLDAAKENFLHSLQKCKELPVGSVEADELALMRCRLYLNLGLVADQKGDGSTAVVLITQSSTLGRQWSFHEDLYRCHFALGTIYWKQKKFGLALEEAKQTVTLSAKLSIFEKVESRKSVGRIYLIIGDLFEAKRSFTAAYKLAAANKGDVSDLKLFVKGTTQLINLKNIDLDDLLEEQSIKHFEKMGDLYAQIKCFEKAIECYKKVVDEALFLGKNEEDMAPIYYSIAQTYDENKQYEEARSYYEKEYEVRLKGEPAEACKTMLAIAGVAENLDEHYNELKQYYDSALELSEKAVHPKLMLHVLRLHVALDDIPPDQKVDVNAKIRCIMEKHGLDSDCELSDDEDNTSTVESDVDLSETDEEYDNVKSNSSNTVTVKNILKTNQFGETALHKACIAGDLKKVKSLVKDGHAVNVRDSAGWLPLHEASNHGHIELVNFLLTVGAAINDRGGKECNGTTPLHDAASCGHWKIMKLLIKKGASAISKNDDGEIPLNSLCSFKARSDLNEEDLKEYNEVERQLRDAMETAGYQVSLNVSTFESSNNRITSNKSFSNLGENLNMSHSRHENTFHKDDHSDDDSESVDEDADPVDVCPREEKAAVPLYRSAISSLGSAATRSPGLLEINTLREYKQATKKAKSGLIEEKEFVGENDFIENDLRVNSRKRKRPSPRAFSELFTNPNKERRITVGNNYQKPNRRSFPPKTKQTKLSVIINRYSAAVSSKTNSKTTDDLRIRSDTDDSHVTDVENEQYDTIVGGEHTNIEEMCPPQLLSDSTNISPSSTNYNTVNNITTSGPMRLRVKVEDKTLLVPIAETSCDCSIEWLTGEVSRRYYQLTGIKPTITLKTSDGAILHPSDPITQVLGADREELVASVTGWELPPLQQRYKQDCLYYRQTPCPLVAQALTAADSSGSLDLQRVTRSLSQLKLVIRAVQRHQNLHTLSFTYTKLNDEGFTSLLEVLPSLTGLSTINLQATGITKKSVTDWTERIDNNEFSKTSLSNINISYNSLIGCTLSNITSLLSLPNITSLNLKHCYLNMQQICPMKSYPLLQILQLDYNSISCSPLKLLLSSIPSIKCLSLCGLQCPTDSSNNISLALTNLLGGGQECVLEDLDLTHTNLSSFDLDNIRAYLYRCPNLNRLSLAHNNQLTEDSVTAVIEELSINFNVPLTSLQLHGLSNLNSDNFASAVIQVLQRKSSMQKPIQSLSYRTFPHSNLIIDTWQALFNDKSKVNNVGSEVFLDVIR
uniref:Tonsoku-like protein n=2 Tax=Hirondellea gigas TaxID=1518452 RepID=A0A6A7FP06_9CRUS